MRRKSKLPQKADAILTSDWHLRDSVPVCRMDNFWAAQWAKVDYVAELQERYGCPVLHGGDLFHHWKPSPLLLSTAIERLPRSFFTVYGNHDLPQHSLALSDRSGIRTLEAAGALTVLPGTHMGYEPEDEHTLFLQKSGWSIGTPSEAHINVDDALRVVVWHQGVWQGEVPWPGCSALSAFEVLEKYPHYDLIVTGDFHKPCVEYLDGQLLVNPGSLMRQSADQIDFRPRVYLWVADVMEAVPVFLPIDPGAVSREHLDATKERDRRIEAFVKRLDVSWSSELSFEANLEKYLSSHQLDVRTETLVRKAVGSDQ